MESFINIISEYFYPENGAAAERITALADFINKHHKINVITSIPEHMIRPGTIDLLHPKDYEIIRVKHSKRNRNSTIIRMYKELQFAYRLSRILLKRRNPRLNIFTSPSPFVTIPAYLTKKINRTDYILDIRDLYPETIKEAGLISRRNIIYKLFKSFLQIIYRNARAITIVNADWSGNLKEYNENVLYVPNGIDNNHIFNPWKKPTRKNILIYSGNFGRVYDFDVILHLAELLKNNTNEILRSYKILLIGDGVMRESIQKKIHEKKLTNVKVIGPFPNKIVLNIMRSSKIGFVSLNLEAESLKGAIPNKIYDYLSSGLEVIALIPGSMRKEILDTGMVQIYNHINYDMIIQKIVDITAIESGKSISRESHPYIYRDYHYNKLLPYIS